MYVYKHYKHLYIIYILIYNILWFYVDHGEVFWLLFIISLFDEPYHQRLSCCYANEFCSLVSRESQNDCFADRHTTTDSNRIFKTPSSRLLKPLQ